MSAITLNLNFSGTILPITDCEDGFQRVPLKPICDVIGLSWADQHKKMQVPYFVRRMGICVGDIPYAGQTRQMVLIRLDRVAAYLNTLNPESVRAAGNDAAADYLEAKHKEWDDLLHAYEQQRGDMFRPGQFRKAMALVRIDRMRDPALKRMALAEIGVSIQEAASANPNGDLFAA
jgi:hypothetical protein